MHGPVALIIMDGWGLAPPGPGNAVDLADTPNFDALWQQHPHTTLVASGEAVGLPAGQMGNSEVGHLNLGAGRVVYQDLVRIDRASADGSLATNANFRSVVDQVRERGTTLHVIGLLSRGGVHSHIAHVEALVEAAAGAGVSRIAVHAITDGRDVSPEASLTDLPAFEQFISKVRKRHSGCDVRIVSVAGRYWTMDRDRRWDRTQRAWDLHVNGVGVPAPDVVTAVRGSHANGVSDEFVEPTIICEGADWTVGSGDGIVFANFRPDRMRQLVRAFADTAFDGFERDPIDALAIVTMTEYDKSLGLLNIFLPNDVHATLSDVLEQHGIGQLHAAETEKYAHVTYFFNGGVEREHTGEVRALADSARDVATYDLKPQMSAREVVDRFRTEIADDAIGFAVVNLANPDMVGHTGSIPATITAVETVDGELPRLLEAVHARGGVALVTADHGNAEQMLTPEGKPHTAHTTNPVPLVLVAAGNGAAITHVGLRSGGVLGDIAPTVLELLGIDKPTEMSGLSLLVLSRPVGART